MRKVVTINLDGNAYQVDEEGFDLLNSYLDRARSRLGANPDVDEIMTDLEQAIADKLSRFLSQHKTVVSSAEVEQVIEEMGPVDSPDEADEDSGHTASHQSREDDREGESVAEPHKLYRLVDDQEKMLAGICAGIAAYTGLDVVIIRIIFIVLAFATSGAAFVAYLVMIFVIPSAKTPQQQAAAYGVPFDARGVVDQARARFSEFAATTSESRAHIHDKVGKMRSRIHKKVRNRRTRGSGSDGLGSLIGLAMLVMAIFIGLAFLAAVVGWFGQPQGVIYGPRHFGSLPWWAVVLMIMAGVWLFARTIGGDGSRDRSFFGSLLVATVQIFLVMFIIWVAYHIFPFVRYIFDGLLSIFTGPFF